MASKKMLWKLIVDTEIRTTSAESLFSEMDIFQLRGCFVQKVEDKTSGLISSAQLSSMLTDLGWGDKEKVLAKFESLSEEREIGDFKTSFPTFVSVLSTELYALRNSYYELDTLFASIDDKKTGYLSIQDLKDLLINQSFGASLSLSEFDHFLKTLAFPQGKNRIRIEDLKQQIIFGMPNILGM
jgi:Ca2+-binding EF-hand superfamily protein